jgi:hypothetical protein
VVVGGAVVGDGVGVAAVLVGVAVVALAIVGSPPFPVTDRVVGVALSE